jgi:hypothetical protein
MVDDDDDVVLPDVVLVPVTFTEYDPAGVTAEGCCCVVVLDELPPPQATQININPPSNANAA